MKILTKKPVSLLGKFLYKCFEWTGNNGKSKNILTSMKISHLAFFFGCKSSKLVEPKTKDELNKIDNFFKSHLCHKNYWVGYAKIQMTTFEECDTPLNDADFRSISDFSPIPEVMWKRSEPNNHRSQGEWCVESEVGKGLNDEIVTLIIINMLKHVFNRT